MDPHTGLAGNEPPAKGDPTLDRQPRPRRAHQSTPSTFSADLLERPAQTIASAALILDVSRQTIYNLVAAGKLRRSTIGRSVRIPTADILALLDPEAA